MTRCRQTWFRAALAALAALEAAVLAAGPATAADDPVLQVKKSRQDLVSAGVSAPTAGKPDTAPPATLEQAMERVRSIQVKLKGTAAQAPTTGALPPAPLTPEVAKPAAVPPPQKAPKEGSSKPAASGITLEELKALPPDGMPDVLALADALYLGGQAPEAFFCYEKALAEERPADAKAWALFQMANCRRQDDPTAAATLYKRVVTEHAASPWAKVAAGQERLVQSYDSLRPPAIDLGVLPAATAAPKAQPVSATPPASGVKLTTGTPKGNGQVP
jgi:tetratricopeptide (TPR) repeat protein